MKKQNKSAVQNQYRVVHTRGQKIKGCFAFFMLFVCGVMVGGALNERHIKRDEITQQNAVAATQQSACETIEEIYSRRLLPVDSGEVDMHNHNVSVYQVLLAHGCPENKNKYQQAINNEKKIIDSLQVNFVTENKVACRQIEDTLLSAMPYADDKSRELVRLDRARIYAQISERGCPENAKKYANLAKQELDIARGVSDDKFNEEETVDIIEIYKRLDMQSAAQEVFDMAKKLTNPTIDFILQVEKILNQN
jgi:hypothetical protein